MGRKLPIFYNALLLTGVNLLLRLVSTSFQVHITARLGAEGVGLLQLVMSVGGLAMTAGMAGIRTATMYLTAEELGKGRPGNVKWVLRGCFLYSILCSCAIGIGVYTAAPWLAENWVGNPQVTGSLRLFATFLPLVCLCGCMTGYFTAANRITTLAGVEICEQLCYMAVTMAALMFWAGSSPERACQSVVMGSGFSACFTLLCLLILRFLEKKPASPRIPVSRRLVDTAIPLADDLKVGISTAENLMVPKRLALFPGEISPLAAFGMVCGMVFPVLMFPAAILFALAELLLPELARCSAAGSRNRIRYLVRRSLRLAMLYGLLCGGLLFILADDLCTGLYNNTGAGKYLRLYALLAPMLYCDIITDAMAKGLGKQKICVVFNIITSAMDVGMLYFLLPKYGMVGYFVSFFISHLVNFLLSIQLLRRASRIQLPFYPAVYALFSWLWGIAGAMTVQSVFGRIAAFLGLFFPMLSLLGVISKKDVRWLLRLVKK